MPRQPSQDQFLDVIDRDEAEQRFRAALGDLSLQTESVAVAESLGRVLASDIAAPLDVPGFDRSNFDGFAVVAADTYAADELHPITLRLLDGAAAAGGDTRGEVIAGTALRIATGGVVPRGATAVVPIEHADIEPRPESADGQESSVVTVRRGVAEGSGIAFAGSDIALGECVLHRGMLLTSRETGVLAALGLTEVDVVRQPMVGIISTGDEVVAPGNRLATGQIYDSNGQILADAVTELGGIPRRLGIVADDYAALQQKVTAALVECDVVLLSGGTSKGEGDLCYRVVSQYRDPGIVAHGVALKPGKPICLAVTAGKPLVVLPGFPTSAIFTFHEFVAPIIRQLGGLREQQRDELSARLAVKVNSQVGRTEYLLVGLFQLSSHDLPLAFPLGKGSGSVTSFSTADGFVTIDRRTELVDAGTVVAVTKLAKELAVPDLVVIGSHCIGVDYLLGAMQANGWVTKSLVVGSTAGLAAVADGQADLAGIHLLDPDSGCYNRPLLPAGVELLEGYRRQQGVVFRADDQRFAGLTAEQIIAVACENRDLLMVNRNAGSGTRVLLDRYLAGNRPGGYGMQSRSHNAVVQAVRQGRADWGVAIRNVAEPAGLAFCPLAEEHFDFAVSATKLDAPAVRAFRELLQGEQTRQWLATMGFAKGG